MATGSPFGPDRNGMEADPEIRIRIREIRFFRIFFFAFFASTDLLGPQGRPRMDRNHLIRIRENRFCQTSLCNTLLRIHVAFELEAM